MSYKLVHQTKDSWNDNPCWDCVFKGYDLDMGDCDAPEEIRKTKEYDMCGYPSDYVFVEED